MDEFGFGSFNLKEADFTESDSIIQLGYPPLRIDLLTSLTGLNFEDCISKRVRVEIDGIIVNFIDKESLRTNKKETGRYQDLADLESLS